MRTKPSFIIVTLVLTLMTVFAAGMRLLAHRVPAPAPNRLVSESADYLQQAAGQRVNWYPYSEIAFAEARREDKPIFFAVGASYSQFGRDLDRHVLNGKEVVNYLNRNFICIRVDMMEQPDWVNNYLPISRVQSVAGGPAQLFFTSGLQYWILDSEGRMYDLIARVAASQKIDRNGMLQILSSARTQFDLLRKGDPKAPNPGVSQKHDVEVLERRISEPPNLPAILSTMEGIIDPVYGGFPSSGLQVPQPQALKLLLLAGRLHSFQHAANPMLHSQVFDFLDGGFFRQSRGLDWSAPDFDKIALVNAELAEVFSMAYAMTANQEYHYAAERTIDSLTGEFVKDGEIRGCRAGDEIPLFRSVRTSFPPRRLHDAIHDKDLRDWAYTALTLDPRLNKSCTPIFSGDLSAERMSQTNKVLEQMRNAAPEPAKFAGSGYAHINAGVIARLISSARLLGSAVKLERALEFYDQLDRFKSNDDIVHTVTGQMPAGNFLIDYLTYADASLQAFLATGRVVYFDNGQAVLRRAKFLFAGKVPGEYVLSRRDPNLLGPQDAAAPEVIDNVGESCTAKMMRLCQAYGRLLEGGKDAASGKAFLDAAQTIASQYGGICNEIGIQSSGFFCASAMLQDDTFAVAVGPACQNLSDQLFKLAPQFFTVQAFGPIRPDLQKRSPGIYIVRSSGVAGPFTPPEAAANLGSSLRVE